MSEPVQPYEGEFFLNLDVRHYITALVQPKNDPKVCRILYLKSKGRQDTYSSSSRSQLSVIDQAQDHQLQKPIIIYNFIN